jgi:hypothetical protein
MDETGDDGLKGKASEYFILSSARIAANDWKKGNDEIKKYRKELNSKFGFAMEAEIHTNDILHGKHLYNRYFWTETKKRQVMDGICDLISRIDMDIVNVVIDKQNIYSNKYHVLGNALSYNIQRIENAVRDNPRKYIIITNKGRVGAMRGIAAKLLSENRIPQKSSSQTYNRPIKFMVEDILEKDSKDSGFIQLCDFVSCFVHKYYKYCVKRTLPPKKSLLANNPDFARHVMDCLMDSGRLNLKASSSDEYGLVIYPKK